MIPMKVQVERQIRTIHVLLRPLTFHTRMPLEKSGAFWFSIMCESEVRV